MGIGGGGSRYLNMDPLQLYPLKLDFRQGYAFSGIRRHAAPRRSATNFRRQTGKVMV